jgi:DHA2 family metal-tetracycline-proton antiporter-like MFS transporter
MISLDVKKTLPWILFLIFFAVLNETVFNISIPVIQKDYALTPTGVSWMMTTFIVFFGAGSVVFGRLSDLFSLKRLIMAGVLIYNLGSVVAFVGQMSYPTVLVGRSLQGMGCSAIPALVMVIVARYFAPEVRGQLFGSIGSIIAVSLGIGPVFGGFVSQYLHWTWLFLVPMATLAALPALNKVLPSEERRPGGVDFVGAALMIVGLGSLIIFLTYPEWPWLVGGLVLMAVFIVRILTAREPFVDPKLFAKGPFLAGVLTALGLWGVLIGFFFLTPLLFKNLKGMDSQAISLVLFPGAISGVFFGPISGRLADKRGNRFALLLGIGLTVAGLIASALMLGLNEWFVSAALLFVYIGFSFLQTGLINAVSQTLPEHETGVGMGVFNLVGILAGAVGTALVARVIEVKLLDYTQLLIVLAAAALLFVGLYAMTLKKSVGAPVGAGAERG